MKRLGVILAYYAFVDAKSRLAINCVGDGRTCRGQYSQLVGGGNGKRDDDVLR
jgi:hypothetical protein